MNDSNNVYYVPMGLLNLEEDKKFVNINLKIKKK